MHSPSPSGVAAGGLWVLDVTKHIDRYPEPSRLGTIQEVVRSNGGGAFNVLVDLHRLGARFPLWGTGLVGDDAEGDWILDRARSHGIQTNCLARIPGGRTSFTDVMTEAGSGRRTFFYLPGVNNELGCEHFDLERTPGRIFYLGYPGLLPRLDKDDGKGTSGVEQLLRTAQDRGMITAVDLVSADSGTWQTFRRALPAVDLLFLNEWEAARLLGLDELSEAAATGPRLTDLCRAILDAGVQQAVILHTARGAVCAPAGADPVVLGSVCVPHSSIRGTCGAGDALAAGFLLGIHEGFGWRECLELGLCSAATCVHALTSSDGVRPWRDCLAYGRQCGFGPF